MTVSKKLEAFLKKEGISYETMHHSAAYTALEVAGAQHVPGKHVIKSVIVKSGKEFMMCVLPAIHFVDFDKLQSITGKTDIVLAKEEEMTKLFPDYEKGAEPPFGHLYNLDVFIDSAITENEYICFNGGSHTDMVKMKTEDYLKLAKGTTADFGKHV